MTKRFVQLLVFFSGMCTPLIAQNYEIGNIKAKRVEITKALDNKPGYKEAELFLAPFKEKVDSFVGPVIGNSDIYMNADRPESLLSNWAADVLLTEASKKYGKIDFAVINIGGLRSSMPKGAIRRGDIIDIAPFQNMLVIITLKGSDVKELFNQFSIYGGEGVSHGVKILMDTKKLKSEGTLKGKKIKDNKLYRIATLDYLAEGNDNMKAFCKAVKTIRTDTPVRDIYMDYISKQNAKGKSLNAKIEGRTVITNKIRNEK